MSISITKHSTVFLIGSSKVPVRDLDSTYCKRLSSAVFHCIPCIAWYGSGVLDGRRVPSDRHTGPFLGWLKCWDLHWTQQTATVSRWNIPRNDLMLPKHASFQQPYGSMKFVNTASCSNLWLGYILGFSYPWNVYHHLLVTVVAEFRSSQLQCTIFSPWLHRIPSYRVPNEE